MAIIDQLKPGNEVAPARSTVVTNFKASQTKTMNAKADALIEVAKRLKDWPLLEEAVDRKLEEQEEFVGWWRKNVRGPGKSNSRRTGGIEMADAEAQTGISSQQVSKWAKRLTDKNKYRAALYGAVWRKAMSEKGQSDLRGASGTGDNQWYTPAEFIELARAVMSGIDLDPATTEQANAVVKAEKYFTEDDDGLSQEWAGRVWLNPPYAQPAIHDFASKMLAEWQSGRVSSAIVLTHNYTDTAWFQMLARAANAICFTRGRVRFVAPDGDLAAPTQGQAFFYFGHDVEAFALGFDDVGFVVEVRK